MKMLDLGLAASQYQTRGFTVVRGLIDPAAALAWAAEARAVCEVGQAKSVDGDRDGEAYRFGVLDGHLTASKLPGLMTLYRVMVPLVSRIAGVDAVLGRDDASAVNVKVHGPGDTHGWHHDTNGITVLAYLQADASGGTEIEVDLQGCPAVVEPSPGDVLFMQGRKLWHRSVPPTGPKVVAPLNYYEAGDLQERPESLDRLLYGGH